MRRLLLSTTLVAGLLPFLTAGKALSPRAKACNNSPDLCDKPYNEITHLGAHDSPFSADSSGESSTNDQQYKTTIQLDAGVRLVSGQFHKSGSEWHMCHSVCALRDAGKLSSWLSDIKSWLDKNTNDVVTLLLVNSDNAKPADIASEFKSAGLDKYAYKPPSPTTPPKTWPTLQELIDKDTRVMVFVASLPSVDKDAPYLMNEFNFIWETPYDVRSPGNFSCDPDRPADVKGKLQNALSSTRLPFMNHFLYHSSNLMGHDVEMPNKSYVATTNAPSGGLGNLGTAADKCKSAWKKQPTFILVDYFDKGPAIETVDRLNNVTGAVGRKDPKLVADADSAAKDGNVFKGLVDLANSVKLDGANPGLGDWVWAGGDWGELSGIPLS